MYESNACFPDTGSDQRNPNDRNRVGTAAGTATQTQSICFAIGDNQYGVAIMAAREIKGWPDLSYLPKHPECGVLNSRGTIQRFGPNPRLRPFSKNRKTR